MIIEKGDENMKGDLFVRMSLIIIVVLLALNLILPILLSSAPSYAAKKIEYKVINLSSGPPYDIDKLQVQVENIFNEYGKEGWEFVALDLQWGLYIFKR